MTRDVPELPRLTEKIKVAQGFLQDEDWQATADALSDALEAAYSWRKAMREQLAATAEALARAEKAESVAAALTKVLDYYASAQEDDRADDAGNLARRVLDDLDGATDLYLDTVRLEAIQAHDSQAKKLADHQVKMQQKASRERDEALGQLAALRDILLQFEHRFYSRNLYKSGEERADIQSGIRDTAAAAEAYEERIRADERRKVLEEAQSLAKTRGPIGMDHWYKQQLAALAEQEGRKAPETGPRHNGLATDAALERER